MSPLSYKQHDDFNVWIIIIILLLISITCNTCRIANAEPLTPKFDTVAVDTVDMIQVTYDSAIVCPVYGAGCLLGGEMPHSAKAKKWRPILEYTIDTTYWLTPEQIEWLGKMPVDTLSDSVWESYHPPGVDCCDMMIKVPVTCNPERK